MKKIFAVLAAVFFALNPIFAKDVIFDDLLRGCADEICSGIEGRVKNIAVVDIETPYWALSDYIVSKLNHRFVKNLDNVNVVTRDEFVAALSRNEIEYNRSGEVTDETIQEFARLGYDCAITGTFSDVAGGYQLVVTAVQTEGLKQFASWEGRIKSKDPDVKYLIEKSKKSPRPVVKLNKKTVVQEGSGGLLGQTSGASSSGSKFSVAVSMINEAGQEVSVLHPKDAVRFKVSSNANAYLAILCVDARKEETWLPLQSNFIRAGESRIFPDMPGAVLRVEEGVYGNESVKVFAAAVEKDLPSQGKMMGTRGLKLSSENSMVAEATVQYRVAK